MKNLKNNSGITLLELVVAVAILALLGTAIIGIMGSNTSIFRKNKADLGVQTSAEETYNRLKEDIMQAKYVYIEGYATDDDVAFDRMKVGKDLSGEGYTFTPIKLLKTNDIYMIDLSSSNCETFADTYCGEAVVSRSDTAELYSQSLGTVDRAKFETLFKSLRYMDSIEARRYGKFLDYVTSHDDDTITSFTPFDSTSVLDKSGSTNKYSNIYITKLIVQYSVTLDEKFVTDDTKIEKYVHTYNNGLTDVTEDVKDNDYCICEYNFNNNEVTYTNEYGAMEKKNTTGSSDKVYSKILNYAKVTDSLEVSAAYANIDGSQDSIGLYMYFDDKNRTYIADGMTYLRNSYVLHDAK